MPEILQYIVQGYVFLIAYYWISFKDNSDFNNVIIKSIAASYILKLIFEKLCNKFNILFVNDVDYMIYLILFSTLLGFVIGKIITQRWFKAILHKLQIGRTTNTNIWDDVIKPYTYLRIFMKDGSSYLGQIRYSEPFKSEPIVVLKSYQKLDKDTDVVIDHSHEENELIMLSTKDFDRIEIVYTDEFDDLSKRIKKIFQIKKIK